MYYFKTAASTSICFNQCCSFSPLHLKANFFFIYKTKLYKWANLFKLCYL